MMLYWHAVKAGLFRLLLQPRSSVPVVLSLALTLAALLTVAVLYRQLHLAPLPHITKPEQLSVHQVNLQMGKGDSWQWPALINDVTFGQALRQLKAYGQWGYLQRKGQLDWQNTDRQRLSQTDSWLAAAGTAEVLGLPLLLGKSTTLANPDELWISDALWQQQFQRNPAVIGQALTLKQRQYRIAGVLATTTALPMTGPIRSQQIWQFFQPAETLQQEFSLMSGTLLILRSPNGQQPSAQFLRDLQLTQQPLTSKKLSHFADQFGLGIYQRDYRQHLLGNSATLLLVTGVAAGLMVLLAVLNLTQLLLAQYAGRQHEFAVEQLCGGSATKQRLLLALENLSWLLPALGLGLLLCHWLLQWVPLLAGTALPMTDNLQLAGADVVVALGLLLVLLTWFSLIWRPGTSPLQQLSGSGKGTPRQLGRWTGPLLLSAQLALAVILVGCSGWLAWHQAGELTWARGFSLDHSYDLSVQLPQPPKDSRIQLDRQAYMQYNQLRQATLSQLKQRLQQQWPDLQVHQGQVPFTSNIVRSFQSVQQPDLKFSSLLQQTETGLFATYQMPVLAGQLPAATDTKAALVLDETAARLISPADPAKAVGQQLTLQGKALPVLAVVRDISSNKGEGNLPQLYQLGQTLTDAQTISLTLKFARPEPKAESQVRALLQDLYQGQALQWQDNQQEWLDRTAQSRLLLLLQLLFCLSSLVLALLGCGGLSLQLVRQQSYELAIRLATGASKGQLLWWLSRRQLGAALVGATIGCAGSILLYQQLPRWFSSIPPLPWLALLLLVSLLLCSVFVTMLWPAQQQLRRDPLQSLRSS